MKKTSTYGSIGSAIFISIFISSVFLVTSFIESCGGFYYEAGSGVGSLVDIDKEKYKTEFLEKYTDSFFKTFPQYKPTQADSGNSLISDSSVFMPSIFHFLKNPNEAYCVQWNGTGFISIRYAYNYDRNELIIENTRTKTVVADSEKLRIEKRFRSEILGRIDSVISKSKDSSIAIWRASF